MIVFPGCSEAASASQPSPRFCGADVCSGRRGKNIAEVDRQTRKPPFSAWTRRPWQPIRATDACRDHFCVSLENEEPGSIIQLHQRPSPRKPSFRKQNQSSPFLQIFGHMFDGVSRIDIHRESAPINHHLFMKPARLRAFRRGHESPIFFEANPHQQPIPPRRMVRQQQYRTRRLEHSAIVNPKAIEQANQELEESHHLL